MLNGGVDLLCSDPNQIFPVIFDSGANKVISGFKEDFVGGIATPPNALKLGGTLDEILIEGTGTIAWSFLLSENK